jgi:DNA-directed RNA polymerase beta subunit
MTINQLIESMCGKVCAITGTTRDATIFGYTDIETVCRDVEEHGFARDGTEVFYDPTTGRKITNPIFAGIVYYQRLQKFAIEACHATNRGPTCAVTRQAVEGKAHDGGLRLGEMEKDVLCGNGAVRFYMQKTHEHSDGFTIYVCRRCHGLGYVDVERNVYSCRTCGEKAELASLWSGYANKLTLQLLMSAMQVSLHVDNYRVDRFVKGAEPPSG